MIKQRHNSSLFIFLSLLSYLYPLSLLGNTFRQQEDDWSKIFLKKNSSKLLQNQEIDKSISFMMEGHIRPSHKLNLFEQEEKIEKWLKNRFYPEDTFWDDREVKNLKTRALSIMEKGGFSLPNDQTEEDSLEKIKNWCLDVFTYEEVLDQYDAENTAKKRARLIFENYKQKRSIEKNLKKKSLLEKRELKRDKNVCPDFFSNILESLVNNGCGCSGRNKN